MFLKTAIAKFGKKNWKAGMLSLPSVCLHVAVS